MNYFKFDELDPVSEQWNAIDRYNASIQDRLPKGAREFIKADWHYDYNDPRCPHDSWLRSINFEIGKNNSVVTELCIRLFGAFHDRDICMRYVDVTDLRIEGNIVCSNGRNLEWIYDEVHLTDSGFVEHVIAFADSVVRIQCRDLRYESDLLNGPPAG